MHYAILAYTLLLVVEKGLNMGDRAAIGALLSASRQGRGHIEI